MRPLLIPATLLAAALACFAVAYGAVLWIEGRAQREVSDTLRAAGYDWAEVSVDGLITTLSGTAPNEAVRFRAMTAAGDIVDPSRVIDAMDVLPAEAAPPPAFSVEMLRNATGISLIGLVPANTDRSGIVARLRALDGVGDVTDLLEAADYPAPPRWEMALEYGLTALTNLPRSKVSVSEDRVAVTAISGSRSEKRRIETDLARTAPDGVALSLSIAAPRPVITPFTVRFLRDERGARFDACSAGSAEGRDRIIAAAIAAGLEAKADCTIGLGQPSPDWASAVEAGLAAIGEIGHGTISLADGDVTLVGTVDTDPEVFDRAVGALESALPEGFSLTARLPRSQETDDAAVGEQPAVFAATLNEDGAVELTGRLPNTSVREAVESYAVARFGKANVTPATRLTEGLPTGWPVRVLAGLEALAALDNGSVTVTENDLRITGVTGQTEIRGDITRILTARLGSGAIFQIDVRYEEALDPEAALPAPEECAARINAALEERKITFAPGSGDIDPASTATVDRIAEIMATCTHVPMEVGGHTDSQGRESMNQELSRLRAEAVVTALQARRVLTGNLTTRGYGEASPIADNGTEEGREANRRIEFRLIEAETVVDAETAEPEATDE